MKQIIDIHSHILPGVDDGCKSKAEALTMLRMYEKQNVEAVICTPHFGPCGIPGANVEGAFKWLCNQNSSVGLYLGSEALAGTFSEDTPENACPRTLASSHSLLVEFDEWGSVHAEPEQVFGWMNYYNHFWDDLILAHPERYERLRKSPEIFKRLAELGIALQINAYDIFDTDNEEAKATTRWLLDNKLVSFIGSDAHGAVRRSPALKNGVQWIYDNCPEEYADTIVHDNAAALLRGEWESVTFGE